MSVILSAPLGPVSTATRPAGTDSEQPRNANVRRRTFVRQSIAGATLVERTRLRRGPEAWGARGPRGRPGQEDLGALFTVVLADCRQGADAVKEDVA
ncbi:hypothetical protein ACBJ59_23745 [Nonomuraea sp. MTCD27]|uniref:hypothetical protein n=1 Tax=Nonomuraea sp. MTCD27 TaxID=1676747 RepID=UPI0035C24081